MLKREPSFEVLEQLWTAFFKQSPIITPFEKILFYWQIGAQLEQLNKQLDTTKHSLYYQVKAALPVLIDSGIRLEELRQMHLFYAAFLDKTQLRSELSWTHYKQLLRLSDASARQFYLSKAANNQWSIKALQRQIKSRFYERSTKQVSLNCSPTILHPKDVLKEHYLLEFLELKGVNQLLERELEAALIEKLQAFLLELGEGFAFVAQQQHITTVTGKHFYIDLVFYHFQLHCFILIDLKIGELCHRDIGQMDMYIRLYEEKWRGKNDQATLGVLLCSKKDCSIEQYSMLADSEQLFAATYQLIY